MITELKDMGYSYYKIGKFEKDGGQFVFTTISIILTYIFDLSAKLKSKLFKNVEDNKLITDGVYGIVRNPVYSGALFACSGVILIANNFILLIVPVICWLYMTLVLIKTEEKCV